MRLSANVITQGRYYKSGEDIPDALLSDAMRKYAVSDIQQQRRDADDVESKGTIMGEEIRQALQKAKPKVKSYVKRGDRFELASKVDLIAGEPLFWHRKRSFGVEENFIAYSRVRSE
jgi:hypothetical protein